MRSTLVQPQQRCCPECDNLGFKRIGYDFFRRPVFRCHACGHEWTTERGPAVGSDRRQSSRRPDHLSDDLG